MAKKISKDLLTVVKDRILHRGDCLERVAFEWGIPMEELIQRLEATYDGGRKNTQYKAILQTSSRNAEHIPAEQLAKLTVLAKPQRTPKPKPAKPAKASPATTPTTTSASVPAVTTLAPVSVDPMEALLRKRDELEEKLNFCAFSVDEAEEILLIRQSALTKAKSVLEKAQQAAEQAKDDETKAQEEAQRTQEQQAEVQKELQIVEAEIQDLKEKTIYLVDPWYEGTLPSYGTFISTEKMEGIKTQEVPEEYLPEASVEGILLFDYVPDYRKARAFCGLVAKHELEEVQYTLLVSDERVKALLEIYIGK